MAKKYNFSRTLRDETFTVEGCDSFDEARKVVDKAIYERQLELKKDEERKIESKKIEEKGDSAKEIREDKKDVGADVEGEEIKVEGGSLPEESEE